MTPEQNDRDEFAENRDEVTLDIEKVYISNECLNHGQNHQNSTEERPLSAYDNASERLQESPNENEENIRNGCQSNGSSDRLSDRTDPLSEPLTPSQALCMMTTVPQNIAARQLGDKHTPTRNSLRHSRMIVMNRNGKIPYDQLPFVIKHYKLVKSMKITTILLGIAMCLISVWLVVWTPTMNAYDYPYWSAVPVLFSGIVGCAFLGCCPLPYPGRRMSCIYYSFKYISMSTTLLSIMSSLVVIFFGSLHILYLQTSSCTPQSQLNLSCVCTASNATLTVFNEKYEYQDLTCDEVQHFLSDIVVASCILNLMAGFTEMSYLFAQWSSSTIYGYTKMTGINGNGKLIGS